MGSSARDSFAAAEVVHTGEGDIEIISIIGVNVIVDEVSALESVLDRVTQSEGSSGDSDNLCSSRQRGWVVNEEGTTEFLDKFRGISELSSVTILQRDFHIVRAAGWASLGSEETTGLVSCDYRKLCVLTLIVFFAGDLDSHSVVSVVVTVRAINTFGLDLVSDEVSDSEGSSWLSDCAHCRDRPLVND